jgi:hypothetical protein
MYIQIIFSDNTEMKKKYKILDIDEKWMKKTIFLNYSKLIKTIIINFIISEMTGVFYYDDINFEECSTLSYCDFLKLNNNNNKILNNNPSFEMNKFEYKYNMNFDYKNFISGKKSIFFINSYLKYSKSNVFNLELNQKVSKNLIVSGWSKSLKVQGKNFIIIIKKK